MIRFLLVGVTVGVLFGTGIQGFAAPPVVWSEQLGLQRLRINNFRISDVRKNQNDSARVAKFFALVALEGTGPADTCNLKARWNSRKLRVKIFEAYRLGGDLNITAKVKRGAYMFQAEEELDVPDSAIGTSFFVRVKRGRKAFRRSPIYFISKRLSEVGSGRHKVTIIGN